MTPDDIRFCERLRDTLLVGREIPPDVPSLLHVFPATSFPKTLWGFALTLSQPTLEDLTVVRVAETVPTENVRKVLNTAMRQQRFRDFRLDDLWGHCRGLMALLRYCGEASDLSVMPQITAAVGYLVACMEPALSDEPPQSAATTKWDEKTCRAVATVLRGYEALTGDVQYRLVGPRYLCMSRIIATCDE